MTRRKNLLSTATACILLTAGFPAPTRPAPLSPIQRGTIELSGSLSFDRTVEKFESHGYNPGGINQLHPGEQVWSTTAITGTPGFGWFATDRLELVTRFRFERIWSTTEFEGEKMNDSVDWTFGTTGLVFWNFPGESAAIPYIGGGGGVLYRKNRKLTTPIFPRLQTGVRFLFGDGASLNTGIYFEKRWNDEIRYIGSGDTKDYGFIVGLSVFLGSFQAGG